MAGKFTDAGRALLATLVDGIHNNNSDERLNIRWITVGKPRDEDYEYPMSDADLKTAVVNNAEFTGEVNRVYLEEANSKVVRVESIFDPDERGWTAGEIALYAETPGYADSFEDATLIWVSDYPEMYIPEDFESAAVQEIITVPIEFENVDAVAMYTHGAGVATLTDLNQKYIAAIAYASLQAIEAAEMDGLIMARIAQLHS